MMAESDETPTASTGHDIPDATEAAPAPAADVVDGVVAVEPVSTGTPAEDVTQGEELPASTQAGAPEIADLDTSLVHAEEKPLPEDVAPAALPAEDVLPATAEKDPQAPVVATAAEAEGASNDLSLVAAEEGDSAAAPTAVTFEQPMVDTREDAYADLVAEAAASAAEVDAPGALMAVDIPAESTTSSTEQGGVVDVAQDASVCDATIADDEPTQPGSSLEDNPLPVLDDEVPPPVLDRASSSATAETPAMADVPADDEVAAMDAPGSVEDAAAAASMVEEAGSGDEAPEYEEAPDAGCAGGEEESEAATAVPMDEAVVPTDAVPPTEAEASSSVAAAEEADEVDDVHHATEPTGIPMSTTDEAAAETVGSVAALVADLEGSSPSAIDEEAPAPGLDESSPSTTDEPAASSPVDTSAVDIPSTTGMASEDSPAHVEGTPAPVPTITEATSVVVDEVPEVERIDEAAATVEVTGIEDMVEDIDGTPVGAVTADEGPTQPSSVAAKDGPGGSGDELLATEVDDTPASAPGQVDDTQGASLVAESDETPTASTGHDIPDATEAAPAPAADVVDGVVAVEPVSTGTPAEDVTQGEELPASAKAGAPEIADLDTSLVHAEEEPLPEDAAPAALPAEDELPATAEKDPQAPVVAAALEAEGGSNDLSLVAAEEGDPSATPTAVTPEQPMVDSREDAPADPVAEAAASAAEVDVPGALMAVDIPAESTTSSAEQGGVVDVAQDASVCDAMIADDEPTQPGSSLEDNPLPVGGDGRTWVCGRCSSCGTDGRRGGVGR
ncbi:unnamed protein product [Pylaiella littoralis]